VFCVLAVLVRLSVPVKETDRKDLVSEMTFRPDVLMGTLSPTHSLTHYITSLILQKKLIFTASYDVYKHFYSSYLALILW